MQTKNPLLKLPLIIALSILAGGALAQPQLSGTPDELRGFLFPRPYTVNINGEGELTAYKDIAKVSLLVTTEERTLNEAMRVNQELRLQLLDQFIAAGIAATDINNSRFASSPQFGIFGRNPNSFEVSARMEVTVGNEQHLQLLAAAADENTEVKFESTEFEHSQKNDFEDQVRELALQDVMEQKTYYESNLGLQLKAINFFYGNIRQVARAMPMEARAEMAMDATSLQSAIPASAAVAPSFDEVKYQTSVTVVFEIISDEG